MAGAQLDGYRQARLRAYRAAQELSWLAKLGIAAGFAGFTALLAQVSLPLPWTPVPLSLVTFAVFLTGTSLGPAWASRPTCAPTTSPRTAKAAPPCLAPPAPWACASSTPPASCSR